MALATNLSVNKEEARNGVYRERGVPPAFPNQGATRFRSSIGLGRTAPGLPPRFLPRQFSTGSFPESENKFIAVEGSSSLHLHAKCSRRRQSEPGFAPNVAYPDCFTDGGSISPFMESSSLSPYLLQYFLAAIAQASRFQWPNRSFEQDAYVLTVPTYCISIADVTAVSADRPHCVMV